MHGERWARGLDVQRSARALGLFAVLTVAAAGGCYGNEVTAFPPGLEPWDMTNLATPPTAAGEMYPETLSFSRQRYMHPVEMRSVLSMHARAYIRAPLANVWRAMRDPQTGRDPVASQGFRVVAYATDTSVEFSYRTHVLVNNITTLEWDVDWRMSHIAGTAEAPTAVASRWQKTSGTTAISVIEGSLVATAVPGQPDVTELQYQYHLNAPFSSHQTIEDYLTVVFGRLKERAHDRQVDPNDCEMCPAAPAGYGGGA